MGFVRYTGTSHSRVLSRRDLSGEDNDATAQDLLVWGPRGEIPYAQWLAFAGSEEKAQEMLTKHSFEFELVGPDVPEIEGEEEFSIEMPVED